MTKEFVTNLYGPVTVRNAMFEDDTNLTDGIEIRGNRIHIDLFAYRDLDELSLEDLEELIDNNY